MSRRAPFVGTVLALPLLLGGCDPVATVAGIHEAPAENPDAASVTEATAQKIAARVLGRAADNRERGASASGGDRRETFSGPALREATAAAMSNDSVDHSATASEDPTVLGVSGGRDWPRAILATSQDGDAQYLHVLVSEQADRPYTLFADVRMAAGASVPALAPVEEGSPVTVAENPDELATAATAAWAKGVAHPAPESAPAGVSFEDAFSRALQKNARAQAKDVKGLATYRQRQALADAAAVSFDLAEGGRLSFLPMTRTDTFTAGSKAKQLTLRDRGVRRVLDTSKVRRTLSIRHTETVAMVTPESGEAGVVGASDVLHSARGR